MRNKERAGGRACLFWMAPSVVITRRGAGQGAAEASEPFVRLSWVCPGIRIDSIAAGMYT